MSTPKPLPAIPGAGHRVTLTLMDLLILLGNLHRGNEDKNVGFEDTDRTVWELTHTLNRKLSLPMGVVESALWSCTMNFEKNKFWHPGGTPFKSWLARLLKHSDMDYDQIYCTISKKSEVPDNRRPRRRRNRR